MAEPQYYSPGTTTYGSIASGLVNCVSLDLSGRYSPNSSHKKSDETRPSVSSAEDISKHKSVHQAMNVKRGAEVYLLTPRSFTEDLRSRGRGV